MKFNLSKQNKKREIKHSGKNTPVGILLIFLIAIIFSSASFYFFDKQINLAKSAISVDGTVIEYIAEMGEEGNNMMYKPVVEYEIDGLTKEYVSDTKMAAKEYRVGSGVELLIDEKTGYVQINSFSDFWFIIFAVTFFGIVTLSISLFHFYAFFFNKKAYLEKNLTKHTKEFSITFLITLVIYVTSFSYIYINAGDDRLDVKVDENSNLEVKPEKDIFEAREDLKGIIKKDSCEDLSILSKYVDSKIEEGYSERQFNHNSYVINSMEWVLKNKGVIVSYPIIDQVRYEYNYSIDDINNKILNSYFSIIRNIDYFNNRGFIKNTNSSVKLYEYQTENLKAIIALEKDDYIYSLVLYTMGGKQSPLEGFVEINCGKKMQEWNYVYNKLLELEKNKLNKINNLTIEDVSGDSSIYGISGEGINTVDYYFLENDSIKLISTSSYPISCQKLKDLDIQTDIRCTSRF